MKYSFQINGSPKSIISTFDPIINDCGFVWRYITSACIHVTISGDGRKIRPFINKLINGFGNFVFLDIHLF